MGLQVVQCVPLDVDTSKRDHYEKKMISVHKKATQVCLNEIQAQVTTLFLCVTGNSVIRKSTMKNKMYTRHKIYATLVFPTFC